VNKIVYIIIQTATAGSIWYQLSSWS